MILLCLMALFAIAIVVVEFMASLLDVEWRRNLEQLKSGGVLKEPSEVLRIVVPVGAKVTKISAIEASGSEIDRASFGEQLKVLAQVGLGGLGEWDKKSENSIGSQGSKGSKGSEATILTKRTSRTERTSSRTFERREHFMPKEIAIEIERAKEGASSRVTSNVSTTGSSSPRKGSSDSVKTVDSAGK